MAAILSKTIQNLDKNFRILNSPVFKWLGLYTSARAIAKAQPFENRTVWNLTFKSPAFKCFGFQMVGF